MTGNQPRQFSTVSHIKSIALIILVMTMICIFSIFIGRAMAKVYKDYSKQVLGGISAKIDMAVQEACISVITQAKHGTPKDTGNLLSNNNYKTSTGKGNLAIGAPSGHSGIVGNLAEYAIPVHFGHKVKSSKGITVVAARPWLLNALVAKAAFILSIFKRRLG
jgi:hypothetical protein